jgi:hypothetical protein
MRKAAIKVEDQLAGWLSLYEHGYHFVVYKVSFALNKLVTMTSDKSTWWKKSCI